MNALSPQTRTPISRRNWFVIAILAFSGQIAWGVENAWLKDLYPKQNRGQFQGVRLFFFVMIPMIIGPATGSFLIRNFGIPTILNGEAGFIPTPMIYYAAAVINLFALLPLLRISKTNIPTVSLEASE